MLYPSELTLHRLWCPVLAPILGAQAGAFFYDAFIYLGDERFVFFSTLAKFEAESDSE
jgi:hypothetical protein